MLIDSNHMVSPQNSSYYALKFSGPKMEVRSKTDQVTRIGFIIKCNSLCTLKLRLRNVENQTNQSSFGIALCVNNMMVKFRRGTSLLIPTLFLD